MGGSRTITTFEILDPQYLFSSLDIFLKNTAKDEICVVVTFYKGIIFDIEHFYLLSLKLLSLLSSFELKFEPPTPPFKL